MHNIMLSCLPFLTLACSQIPTAHSLSLPLLMKNSHFLMVFIIYTIFMVTSIWKMFLRFFFLHMDRTPKEGHIIVLPK